MHMFLSEDSREGFTALNGEDGGEDIQDDKCRTWRQTLTKCGWFCHGGKSQSVDMPNAAFQMLNDGWRPQHFAVASIEKSYSIKRYNKSNTTPSGVPVGVKTFNAMLTASCGLPIFSQSDGMTKVIKTQIIRNTSVEIWVGMMGRQGLNREREEC